MAAAVQGEIGRDPTNDPSTRISSVPLLGEGFAESTTGMSDSPSISSKGEDTSTISEQDLKTGKRKFWGFGKKRDEMKAKTTEPAKSVPPTMKPISLGVGSSPKRSHNDPSSPNHPITSTSPRLVSPASSQIFERNVQEDGLYAQASPAIPSHITTENHIPPVLDASAETITNDHLDPDNVEIVMHSAHQPAAVTVTGGGGLSEATGSSWGDDLVSHPDAEDTSSSYGALDSTDVHRLSFISFADVVHAEQADHVSQRDSTLLLLGASGLPSPVGMGGGGPRSPSPIRSPVSPPLSSTSPSFRGLDASPNRGGRMPGSPRMGQHSPPAAGGGELTIETMRQALRKTGSGDLSGVRSPQGLTWDEHV